MFRESPLHKNAPLSAAVESDVVGYTTIELTKKFTLVGINFSSLNGDDALPIREAVSGEFGEGDQLQIQNEYGSYIVLEWKNGQWYGLDSDTPATVEVRRGTGVWIVSNTASKESPVRAVVQGAVNLSDSLTTDFGNSFVIAAAGLPVDTTPNSNLFKWEGVKDGDNLQIPNEYGSYTVLQWEAGQWVGDNSTPATAKIPKESAIWLISSSPDAKVIIDPTVL